MFLNVLASIPTNVQRNIDAAMVRRADAVAAGQGDPAAGFALGFLGLVVARALAHPGIRKALFTRGGR